MDTGIIGSKGYGTGRGGTLYCTRRANWPVLSRRAVRRRFNETGFALLSALLPSHGAAVAAALTVLGGLTVALAFGRMAPEVAALCVTAAWLLLAANVLPWYALWPIGLAAAEDDGPAQVLGVCLAAYLLADRVPI